MYIFATEEGRITFHGARSTLGQGKQDIKQLVDAIECRISDPSELRKREKDPTHLLHAVSQQKYKCPSYWKKPTGLLSIFIGPGGLKEVS